MGVMLRDPVQIPRRRGIFALINKSKGCAYVAFTTDLQKRSHSLAHMLQNPKTHWSIKALPKDRAENYTFTVISTEVDPHRSERLLRLAEKTLGAKYEIIDGSRSAAPMVTLKGVPMTLTDAIKKSKCRSAYITVWRRLSRGWTTEQALGLDEPPIRWSPEETAERRARARLHA